MPGKIFAQAQRFGLMIDLRLIVKEMLVGIRSCEIPYDNFRFVHAFRTGLLSEAAKGAAAIPGAQRTRGLVGSIANASIRRTWATV
jgi:hypothetical protein